MSFTLCEAKRNKTKTKTENLMRTSFPCDSLELLKISMKIFLRDIIKINLFMNLFKHHCRIFPLHLILPPVWKDMSWQWV